MFIYTKNYEGIKKRTREAQKFFGRACQILINGHIAEGVKSVAQYHNRQCSTSAFLCHPQQTDLFLVNETFIYFASIKSHFQHQKSVGNNMKKFISEMCFFWMLVKC